MARNLLGIPLASMVYSRAKSDSMMETIIAYEMSLSIGKMLAALLGIALLFFLPGNFNALFALAAGMTLLYAFFPKAASS